MICFHFSNFEPLETALLHLLMSFRLLWFAFILVTLSHWKQHIRHVRVYQEVVICFHFSNFEPLETASYFQTLRYFQLWFAFILVTLSHWKQHPAEVDEQTPVVICFHFSNFEPLETASTTAKYPSSQLWFAFILVTLSHWKQLTNRRHNAVRSCDLLSF